MDNYSHLQLREVFHIEFLRWLGRKVKAHNYAVKGGVNLRLFFKSFRYSEDMDMDARGITVAQLGEIVTNILKSPSFADNMKPFGIAGITAPDMTKAKQTKTTQRFKVHLTASSGEDLFTKIEFSRRGFIGSVVADSIDNVIARAYMSAPLIVPHYDARSAAAQKLIALAGRKSVQARDIFDLFILTSQYTGNKRLESIDVDTLSKAYERIFEVDFGQFRDTVVSFLSAEDQAVYDDPQRWEDIRLKAAAFIEEIRKTYA